MKLEKFHRYLDKDGDGIPYRTLPGVHPEGRVLHARLGSHPVRRLHRGLGRIPDRARPADAQVRDGEAARAARPSSSRTAQHRHRAWWPTAAPTARCARRSTSSAQRGVKAELHAPAVVPVRRRRREIPRAAQAGVRRRAEPRRADALAADARDARARRRSCARCCITAACRSPRSSSSRACSPRSSRRPASPKPCRAATRLGSVA